MSVSVTFRPRNWPIISKSTTASSIGTLSGSRCLSVVTIRSKFGFSSCILDFSQPPLVLLFAILVLNLFQQLVLGPPWIISDTQIPGAALLGDREFIQNYPAYEYLLRLRIM